VDFDKCCKTHKHVLLFNHLNSVGAYLEADLKTCKGFCVAIASIMPGTRSIRFLPDLLDKGF